jgi:methionyl-tRNA formyltransferase
MRVAVIGRTRALLSTAEALAAAGHDIPLVWTTKKEGYYDVGADDYQKFADAVGARFFNVRKINDDDAVKGIQASECDIAISVNWPTLLDDLVLNSFEFGVLNAHLGDLPRFRGNACPNWAILNGEERIGLCIHRMTSQLDSGPVFARDAFPLSAEAYIGDVYDWFEDRLPSMFIDTLNSIARGENSGEPQPGGGRTFVGRSSSSGGDRRRRRPR